MNKHLVEYTDTFAGEANYCWVRRYTITMPELTHYAKANKVYARELMRRAKALCGLTGVRGKTWWHGDEAEFRPYGMNTIMFISYDDTMA